MKHILLTLILLASTTAFAQVFQETAQNNRGQLVLRIVNNINVPVTCYFQDTVSYYTFSLYPGQRSGWFLVYGRHSWGCR